MKLSFSFFCAMYAAGFAGTSSQAQALTSKPNIIVIQPDDIPFFQEWGPPPAEEGQYLPTNGLPNIERLREHGMQMLQAYTASPMCGTSRFSTMTGRYPSRSAYSRELHIQKTGNFQRVNIPVTKLEDVDATESRFDTIDDPNDCSVSNAAVAMKDAGYATGMFGKWHLSHVETVDTDDDDSIEYIYNYADMQAQIEACGFDKAGAVYAENLIHNIYSTYDPTDPSNPNTFTHNMEYVAMRAINWMERRLEEDEEPFFMYFNPTVPHDAHDVSEALTLGDCRATPEGYLANEPYVAEMFQGHDNCADYRASVVSRANLDPNSEAAYYDDEVGAIWLDDAIGALLDMLESHDALNNTMIVFQADHGMSGKGNVYEQGLRIPQFVHYPDMIGSGSTYNEMVSTVDVLPSILEAVEETEPYEMDGTSWYGSAVEGDDAPDRCVWFEGHRDRSLRCGCWKYSVYSGFETNDGGCSSSETRKSAEYGCNLGYDVDMYNLYYLCDENGDYISDDAGHTITSQEATNLADAVDEDTVEALVAMALNFDCFLDRTDPQHTTNEDVLPMEWRYATTKVDCSEFLDILETLAPESAF